MSTPTKWSRNKIMKLRPDTSDIKAYREVVEKKGYERRDFKPESGEKWLDIGAHIGSFSWLYRKEGVEIIAFEPCKNAYEMLCQNSYGNNIRAGLSDFDGDATMSRNTAKGNEWRNSIYKKWQRGTDEMVEIQHVKHYIEPGINIKLDNEGAEKQILDYLIGSGEIKNVNKLVFEWSFDINKDVRDYMKVLRGLEKTHKLLNVTENHKEKYGKLIEYPASWFPAAFKVFAVKKSDV